MRRTPRRALSLLLSGVMLFGLALPVYAEDVPEAEPTTASVEEAPPEAAPEVPAEPAADVPAQPEPELPPELAAEPALPGEAETPAAPDPSAPAEPDPEPVLPAPSEAEVTEPAPVEPTPEAEPLPAPEEAEDIPALPAEEIPEPVDAPETAPEAEPAPEPAPEPAAEAETDTEVLAAEPAPISADVVAGADFVIGEGDENGLWLRCGEGVFEGWSDFYIELGEGRTLPKLDLYQPERPGYRFTGWYLEGGEGLSAGSVIAPGVTEIFAHYVRVVTLDAGPGNFTAADADNNYTRTVDLEGDTLPAGAGSLTPVYAYGEEKQPATFTGWYTERSIVETNEQDGYRTWSIRPGGSKIEPGSGTVPAGVTTLYAGYQATEEAQQEKHITYFLDYNGINGMWGHCLSCSRKVNSGDNGYRLSPGDLAVRYLNWDGETDISLDSMESLRAYWDTRTFNGYTFLGWATAANAPAPDVDDSTVLKDGDSIYAVWTRDDDTNSQGFERVDPAAGPVESLHIEGLSGGYAAGSMTWSAHKAAGSAIRFGLATSPARASFDTLTWTVSNGSESKTVTFAAGGGSVSETLGDVTLTADGRELTVTCAGDGSDVTALALTVDAAATVKGSTVANSGSAVTAVFTHSWEVQGSRAPTCTEAGETKLKCRDCDKTNTTRIGPTGHTYNYSKQSQTGQEITPATCTQPGEKVFTCLVCKSEESKVTVTIPALGHEWEETRTHVNCILDEITRTCQRSGCHSTTTQQVKASNPALHSWSSWSEDRAATETATGSESRHCTTCGAVESQTLPVKPAPSKTPKAPKATPAPTHTPTEAPEATPAPTPTPTEAPEATPAPTPEPTETPKTPAPVKPAAPKPSAPPKSAAPTPTPTETPKATPAPTPEPTEIPEATPAPTPEPTEAPKATPAPTPEPTETPKATPVPTPKPTETPKATPTSKSTAAPAATPTPAPASPYGEGVTGFTNRLYDVCLDRSADAAGLADWTDRLQSYEISGAEAARGFVFSEEFQSKNYSSTEYVQQLYRAILGREADAAGLADWVARLDSGTSREAIFDGFAQSREFQTICADYGIASGAGGPVVSKQQQEQINSFVERLYDVCLDRSADSAGKADWSSQLQSHANTGKGVAYGFVFSKEFQGKNYDDATYIEYLYRAFFGREADAAGKADWLDRMAGGWSREQVFEGFVGSKEFTNLCNRYGIARE